MTAGTTCSESQTQMLTTGALGKKETLINVSAGAKRCLDRLVAIHGHMASKWQQDMRVRLPKSQQTSRQDIVQ
ncbi:hypothetical protein GGI22_007713 [Coemansia erecta]|nr:hypothetical protein GGI22_007713 [Coemansia erecta]